VREKGSSSAVCGGIAAEGDSSLVQQLAWSFLQQRAWRLRAILDLERSGRGNGESQWSLP
jgi:hypothetical protein